jgi:hypothetical protein
MKTGKQDARQKGGQTQKAQCCMIPLIRNIQRDKSIEM